MSNLNETLMELVNDGKAMAPRDFDGEKAKAAINRLKSLGFETAIKDSETKLIQKEKEARISKFGYMHFNTEKIEAFLDRKVAAYNKKAKKPSSGARLREGYGYVMGQVLNATALPAMQSWTVNYSPIQTTTGQADMNSLYDARASKKKTKSHFNMSISRHTVDYYSPEKDTIGKYVWNEVGTESYQGIPPARVLDTFEEHKNRQVFDYFTVASVEGLRDPLLLGRIDGSEERYFIAQWDDDVNIDDII